MAEAQPSFVAVGDVAKLWVGYQLAAEMRGWDLTYQQATLGEGSTHISGRIAKLDEFWSTQVIDRIDVWMGKSWWSWTRIAAASELRLGSSADFVVRGIPTIRN